jgi:hypothetical protein
VGTFRAPHGSLDHEDAALRGPETGMTLPDTSEVAGFDQV